jgi:hypothetical protein
MSGGGLMQLVAYGAQDIYLTGNPQITFFKVIYRRHTNFSMEAIEQVFNGTADFGKKVSCTISRNGDLMYRVYLQVTLPEWVVKDGESFRWLNWIGHVLISDVDVEIGGQRMDKQYGQWLHIWNELTQQPGLQAGYAAMVGNVPGLTQIYTGTAEKSAVVPSSTLYIPLQFWFCRNPGLALPLIALQYHEVKICLDFAKAENCYWAAGSDGSNLNCCLNLQGASLYVDYIYLDTDERRRFAQVSHEYLIEQLQFTGKESVNSACNKIKLGFNHPCKELIWVAQPHKYTSRDCMCKAGVAGQQWFNFTDQVDQTYFTGTPTGPLGGGMGGANAARMWNAAALPIFGNKVSDCSDISSGINTDEADKAAFQTGVGNPMNPNNPTFPLFDSGKNCFSRVKLQLNGHDRFSERAGSYFNLVQPYQHHTNVPATGINVYSFALKPEEHQPSGTCNMSRIDNATLQVTLTADSVGASCPDSTPQTVDIYVYATNYNVLRIMSGMGGLAYSN